MDLVVMNRAKNQSKRFYSAEFGRWTMENARANTFRPFAPLTLQGRSSTSDSILFYSYPDEQIGQIVEANCTVTLALEMRTAEASFVKKPKLVSFQVAVPEIDHRIFTKGTWPLYNTDWRA
jgi:hypothetical protein